MSENSYGLHEEAEGHPRHLEVTLSVPCVLGTVFGSFATIRFSDHERTRLPLRWQWETPPISGVRLGLETFPNEVIVVDKTVSKADLTMAMRFDIPDELVSGKYTLRVFDCTSGRVFMERTFHVSNCPE